MLSRTRARSCSRPDRPRPSPMMGTRSFPRLAIACRAGKIFLYARSPVAPNSTSASDWAELIAASLGCGLLHVSPEFETHRRKQLVLKIGLAAGVETLIDRCGEHGGWYGFIDGRL